MLTVTGKDIKIPKGYPQMLLESFLHRMNDDKEYLLDKNIKKCPNVVRFTSDEALMFVRSIGKPNSYTEYIMTALAKLLDLGAVKHLGSKYYMISPFLYAKYDMKYHEAMKSYYARIDSKKSFETI